MSVGGTTADELGELGPSGAAGRLEPFLTARQVVDSGLFPDLTEEKIRHYVRQGAIRAYGPSKNKTYLLSEVYEDWKKIGRRVDGIALTSRKGSLPITSVMLRRT